MYLEQLQENWNSFGEEDAMWSICTTTATKHNRWDKKDFFKTGVTTVESLVSWMGRNGYPKSRSVALDFGCGVGRLTQALCAHFDQCVGVDIAPSMIRQAKEFNRFGKRCVYRLNETDDLSVFPSSAFDLINTEHVLQHIRPSVAVRYIAEFVRVLKPGGLARFHCPSARATFAYPEQGFHGSLKTDVDHLVMEHLSSVVVPVRFTNSGNHPIGMSKTINAPVRIWQHWHNVETGETVQNHDYANVPPSIIEPGESIKIEYRAASPAVPGKYMLILSLSNYFNVPLLGDASDVIAVSVEVKPRTVVAEGGTDEKKLKAKRPKFESNVIPENVVRATVMRAGGRVLEVVSSQSFPGSVVSTNYYVTK